mmetsp:Transcript_131055/g.261457  ORF Transcript_131055/g.261457 Transcript_131055/m.261457 type:complete len:251 (+) Transcript_131055:31-783(+)
MDLRVLGLLPAGVPAGDARADNARSTVLKGSLAVRVARRRSTLMADAWLPFRGCFGFAVPGVHVAELGAFGILGRFVQRKNRRCKGLTCSAGTATATLKKVETKTKTATALWKEVERKTKTKTQTYRNMWGVMVHAPIRNCKAPWCKIPGLKRMICTCLKDGVGLGAVIKSKDRAFTLDQFAEVLGEGVPELSRKETEAVSSRLFESGMTNPDKMGTAIVIATFRRAAEDYHKKLTCLGLWSSVEQLDDA